MLDIVIDLVKNVLDKLSEHKKANREKKDRVSFLLEEISTILLDTSQKLLKDEYPHGNCVVMESLSNRMVIELSDIIDYEDLGRLHTVLIESSNLEKEYANRKNPDTINKIEKASGEFKAMSLLLKI